MDGAHLLTQADLAWIMRVDICWTEDDGGWGWRE